MKCIHCGRQVPLVLSGMVHAQCRAKEHALCVFKENGETLQLGDELEAFLTSLGITKEYYSELKQQYGLSGECGCEGRKEWLNWVGQKTGLNDLLTRFQTWRFERHRRTGGQGETR